MKHCLAWWITGSLALTALGCSSNGSSTSTNLLQSNAASGLLVSISDPLPKEDSPEFARPTLNLIVEVLNLDGNPIVPPQKVISNGGPSEVLIPGVAAGQARVLLRVEGPDEELLATQEAETEVLAQGLTVVTFRSTTAVAATREIGLVSLGANGAQGTGTSNSPALSSDGRFVAFESRANLLSGNPQPGTSEIYVRDRLFLTLSRASLSENNQPLTADSFEPDISGDGRYVVFRRGGVSQGPILVRDRGFGNEPAKTLTFNPGSRPKISGDGRFIVFQNAANGLQQIFLRGTQDNLTEVPSRSNIGAPSNGINSSPSISQDGQFVVFHSTATDLVSGQGAGIYLRDRSDQSIVRLPIASNLSDVSISSGGRFVLASAPGQIPFLFDRVQNSGVPLSNIGAGLVGRPSISQDGQRVAFFSENAGLIDKDINGQADAFVLDRASNSISRVNVSNDGTAVVGGVDQTSSARGPVISSLGNRVAFAAADRDLVPNGRSQLDVYSASAPTPGQLYVISGNEIHRFEGANTANGPVLPAAKISSFLMVSPQALFLDVTNNRMYVLTNGDEIREPEILVYNQISTRDNGTSPDRRIRLGNGFRGRDLALDITRNTLYVLDREEVLALANASNLNGQVPASGQRRFRVADSRGFLLGLLLDTRLNEVYFGTQDSNRQNTLVVVPGAGSVGVVDIKRRLFGPVLNPSTFIHAAFDTSPRSFAGGPGNDSSLLLLSGRNQATTLLSNGSRSGFLGSPTPQLVIPGSDETILVNAGTPKEFGIGPEGGLYFDPTTHLRYVGDKVRAEVQVFRSSGGATPIRTIRVANTPSGGVPIDIAIDRTR